MKPKVSAKYTALGPRVMIDFGHHDGGDHGVDQRCWWQLRADELEAHIADLKQALQELKGEQQ